ncbi:hypothetical protein [Neobacillus sp. PS3-40]|jgi:hypothetical protein|uniref:hypothetical protein n=1 Tax=Neobacillus sp. PS3-40 TaxID=3070679 RepID=UPI0027E1C09C|nr:hypothetical protein [Neobacillus sp. PS3-40]WML45030.1 hypothetical protein RCG20_03770 [Neobacillus sp. PS3-40]
MYRFSIDGENWILRFTPQIAADAEEKHAILLSLLKGRHKFLPIPNSDAFIMINEKIGAIIFNVKKVPSSILTVSNIIPKEQWYFQD